MTPVQTQMSPIMQLEDTHTCRSQSCYLLLTSLLPDSRVHSLSPDTEMGDGQSAAARALAGESLYTSQLNDSSFTAVSKTKRGSLDSCRDSTAACHILKRVFSPTVCQLTCMHG